MLICVGIPTIDGKVCAATVDSLLAEQVRARGQGDALLILWQCGTSLIGVARNKIAMQFIDTPGASVLVFVDSDISWKCGDLLKLAHMPQDVIGATYRAKEPDEHYHVFMPAEKEGELYKVRGIPGGFMKINRHAFENVGAYPYKERNGTTMLDWFPTGLNLADGVLYGEDYGFCRIWREQGGTVWLDPSIQLKHWESAARCFTGDPKAWLEKQVVNG